MYPYVMLDDEDKGEAKGISTCQGEDYAVVVVYAPFIRKSRTRRGGIGQLLD